MDGREMSAATAGLIAFKSISVSVLAIV